MVLSKFGPNDVFHNIIKAKPKVEFIINNHSVYYNRNSNRLGVSSGSVNLNEASASIANMIITKAGHLVPFKTISRKEYNQLPIGSDVTASSNLEAKIASNYFVLNQSRVRVAALENTLDHYKVQNPYYEFSNTFSGKNKGTEPLRMISIPSIFYGSSMEKGTVKLKLFVTGTLAAELHDTQRNGSLIEVTGTNPGNVAGVVLYKEGFILLTGSWSLHPTNLETYESVDGPKAPAWIYFGATGSIQPHATNTTFQLNFNGINKIPTLSLFCHARKGEQNHSNNPTYIEHGQSGSKTNMATSSFEYKESDTVDIKNMVKVNYTEEEPKFEKVTYISKVAVYDEEKNVIGIAKLATPVRKKENEDLTIKLKMDF